MRYVVAQVDRAKVLLQGSRTIVGLYVNPGDNNMLTIKVWGPCLLAGPRVKAACFKMKFFSCCHEHTFVYLPP